MPRRRRPSAPRPAPRWDALYPTLDLHGETADDARALTERWLRRQQEAGERMVRVITGRGLHSVGPPVLRAEIDDLLLSLRGGLVAGHTSEPGGGAFRVELHPLRLQRRRQLRPTRPPLPDDPELRREAEESLVELGVYPNPTLVEAEMRRIARERGGEEG